MVRLSRFLDFLYDYDKHDTIQLSISLFFLVLSGLLCIGVVPFNIFVGACLFLFILMLFVVSLNSIVFDSDIGYKDIQSEVVFVKDCDCVWNHSDLRGGQLIMRRDSFSYVTRNFSYFSFLWKDVSVSTFLDDDGLFVDIPFKDHTEQFLFRLDAVNAVMVRNAFRCFAADFEDTVINYFKEDVG